MNETKKKLSLQVITGNKIKAPNLEAQLLNLKPKNLTNKTPDLGVWYEETQVIKMMLAQNSPGLSSFITEAVINKMNLEDADRQAVADFIKFYLESDPTILDKI